MRKDNLDLSVVIPTYNEKAALPKLLEQLSEQENVLLDIVVADGGSTDKTRSLAKVSGARVIRCDKGRGKQMNAGAQAAKGDLILFLHADSELSANNLLNSAIQQFNKVVAESENDRIAGHFSLLFNRTMNTHRLAYRFYQAKTMLNRLGTVNGDQAFLLRRRYFDELGGYDERLPFLEDQTLAEQICQSGRWLTLPGELKTSARRFEKEGLARRMILSAITMALHNIGFSQIFAHAPLVYQSQDETGRLQLTSFLRLVSNLFGALPLKRRFSSWLKIGRYVRGNIWQVFFFLDVLLRQEQGRRPCLRFHDAAGSRLPGADLLNAPAALLTWIWFRLTRAYFSLAERKTKA